MSKLKAVMRLLTASNWLVITDISSDGDVSPLYAQMFIQKVESERDRLRLSNKKHEQNIERLAEQL